MRKEKRKKEVRLRKRLIPISLLLFFLWALLTGFIYFIEPAGVTAIFSFFVLMFLTTFLTTAVIFANTRRGVLAASAVCIFLVLRYFGVGNVLNLILLLAIVLTVEFYLNRK